MLFEAVSKKKTSQQQKDVKELRYEGYAQALIREGLDLKELIFPILRQRHAEKFDLVVPKEEADDFFRWLPLSAVYQQGWEVSSEKFDEGLPRDSQHRRRGPFGTYW